MGGEPEEAAVAGDEQAHASRPEAPPIDALLGGRPGDPELPPAFARITRRTFDFDVELAYDRVTAGLRAGVQKAHRMEYADLVDKLDEASELSLLAAQLDAASAVIVTRYEADLEVLRSDMRAQATAALAVERAGSAEKGAPKAKQITNDDVTARMAGAFPAEYRRLEELLARAKATRGFVKTLPEQWGARRREIEAMLRTSRKI